MLGWNLTCIPTLVAADPIEGNMSGSESSHRNDNPYAPPSIDAAKAEPDSPATEADYQIRSFKRETALRQYSLATIALFIFVAAMNLVGTSIGFSKM